MQCPKGHSYPIVRGIPRFAGNDPSVTTFGDQWNFFNWTMFKRHWLEYYVKNTFGNEGTDVFKGKDILDCGSGSGAISKWMVEYGAEHLWALELSHSVDGNIRQNLRDLPNAEIVQCDISKPPFAPNAGGDLVVCQNVIQHTKSVKETAQALWTVVRPGGEFVLTCYMANDEPGMLRWLRWQWFRALRGTLSSMPGKVVWAYSWLMSHLVPIPVLGRLLILSYSATCGPVFPGPDRWARTRYQTYVNTHDMFAKHYQHYPSRTEFRALVEGLQPPPARIDNLDSFFGFPTGEGVALRIHKGV